MILSYGTHSHLEASQRSGTTPPRTGKSRGRGLNASQILARFSSRGDISLDIPFYRTKGVGSSLVGEPRLFSQSLFTYIGYFCWIADRNGTRGGAGNRLVHSTERVPHLVVNLSNLHGEPMIEFFQC